MYGLYDTDGILRFTGNDKESCLAYAELFDMHSMECSLMALPEVNIAPVNHRTKNSLGVSSN